MSLIQRLQTTISRSHLLKKIPTGFSILFSGARSGNSSTEYDSIEEGYQNRSKQSLRKGNYTKTNNTSILLRSLIDEYTGDKDVSVLEIGCNAGRNLICLYDSGYRNLSGVELNSAAIELMREEFPELEEDANITVSRIQNIIGDFDDNQFDVVYTMAVLQHIDRDTEDLFSEMARITKDILIINEAESDAETFNSAQFVFRDYHDIFSKQGMHELDHLVEGTSEANRKISNLDGDMTNHQNYTVRVFSKPNVDS
jgi:SAM-dependent methyltransferase